ncbi:MAG: acyltransferase [Bacteroidetes bacterium]|nr:acyltransferase [Bacteroidota bacterium]
MHQRIPVLDGFRCIAILLVLFYHLTTPQTTHYPHNDFFPGFTRYGYTGVFLFFTISGFIIPFSLEHTPTLRLFIKKRFLRLFPAMLLCSLITLLIARNLDTNHEHPAAHEFKNLLPSLTFTNPSFWTIITRTPFHWINGSYWTLWVEIQFYAIAALLYYWRPQSFFKNFFLAATLIGASKYGPTLLLHNDNPFLLNWKYCNELFNLTFNIGWFTLGVFFYQLYKNNKKTSPFFISAMLIFLSDIDRFQIPIPSITTLLLAILLFTLMIKNSPLLLPLKLPLITRIGKISYGLYLIHEVAGLILVNKYYPYLGPLSPFIFILAAIGFAELSYRFFEKRFLTSR